MNKANSSKDKQRPNKIDPNENSSSMLMKEEKKDVVETKKKKSKKHGIICWAVCFFVTALLVTLVSIGVGRRLSGKYPPKCGAPPTAPIIENNGGLIYSATYDVIYGRAKLNYMGLVTTKSRFIVYSGAPEWQPYNCMYEVPVRFQFRDNITDWVRPYLDPIINSMSDTTPVQDLPEPILIPYASYNVTDLTGVTQQNFASFQFKSATYNKDGFLFFFNGTIGGSRITIMRKA